MMEETALSSTPRPTSSSRREWSSRISSRGIEGAPDLVVEILSPRTASKDFLRKRWAYEAAGIPEYLVVDPDERYGLLLRLSAGRYEEAARVAWGVVLPLLGGRITITLA